MEIEIRLVSLNEKACMNEQVKRIFSSAYYSKIVKGDDMTSVFDMILNGGRIRRDKFAPHYW